MDRIKEMLDRLSELDEGQMADLESSILSEFETVEKQEPSADVVAAMTALADALDSVRTEQASRSAAASELAAKAAELSSRIHGEASSVDEGTDGPDDTPETDADTPEETDQEKEDEEQDVVPPMFSESGEATPDAASEPAAETVAEVAAEPVEEPAEEIAADTAAEAPAAEVEETSVAAASIDTAVQDAEPAAEASAAPTIPEQSATQPEENPVAASAQDVVVQAPADSQPVSLTRPPVTVTAGADIPGRSAGQEFSNLAEVSDAFVKRLHSLRRVTGGDGEQHIVASIHADYPEDRTLYAGNSTENWAKITKITSREALVAAATCYPLDTQYDLFGVGVADRPVRDSLAVFNAERGGLRYYSAPALNAVPLNGTGPTGIWKQDGSVTSPDGSNLSGTKPCYTVACGDEKTALLEAVSLCLTFDNLGARANPEIVARHNELALIFQARVTELATLGKIKTGGTAVTGINYNVGAAREFFAQVDGLASAYRYKFRMGARSPLRVIAPEWFRDQMRADIAMQMPGDGLESLGVAGAMIDSWFRIRNINVTWSLDSIATPPSITTGAFGGTVEWDLFAEGTWLYLDGGTLDIGVIRDSTLVGSNDYKTFTEEFMGVTMIGDQSLHITSTVLASGAAAALEDNFS